ncbi:MAG TPA: beta-galactosidase [bacterium]|jgi:hypothetical protein
MGRIVALLMIAALAVPSSAAAQPPPAGAGVPAMAAVAAAGADFGALRKAGALSVKLVADWSELEPAKGQFVWKPLDDAVAAATAAGLTVVLVLAYTPKWASLASGPELSNRDIYSRQPPKRIGDWEAFVTGAVTRYKAKVKDWQIWTSLNLPFFRGTASEYLALLRAARSRSKAADPSSRIVMATPQGMDLSGIRRAMLQAGTSFDVISLNPQGLTPEALMRPLRALRDRLLANQQKEIWIEWDPRGQGDRQGWGEQWLKVVVLARTFRVARVFWSAPPTAEVDAARKTFDGLVGGRAFAGYLTVPGAVALVFGKTDAALIAWGTPSADLRVSANGSVYAANGDVRQPAAEERNLKVALAADPVIIADLDPEVVAQAGAVLQDKGLPVPTPGKDFAGVTEVRTKLGKANAEEGLYNMPFRSRRNGAVDVVEVDGAEAVRTNTSKEIVFIYFDVDDSFLYYVDGRATVEVSVEVRGASAPQQLGFNLLYDSMTGYRFTSWQWVEARPAWVTYTFKLTDAGFANTWGWDFAITAVGNRKEDLTVRSVTVRKIPKP